VQFEEMNGWNATLMQLRCFQIGITEEHHYTLMGDLEGKIKVRVFWRKLYLGIQIYLSWMSLPMIWILKLLLG
jgi:hypothetical protein